MRFECILGVRIRDVPRGEIVASTNELACVVAVARSFCLISMESIKRHIATP